MHPTPGPPAAATAVYVGAAIGAWCGLMLLALLLRAVVKRRWPQCPAACADRAAGCLDCRACDLLSLAQCCEGLCQQRR